MDKRLGLFAGLTALFAVGSAGATVTCPAFPVDSDINPDTGHFFEIYAVGNISWIDAKACATKSHPTDPTVTGHLATITSDKEDAWINALRAGPNGAGLGEVWVGGSQPSPLLSDEPGLGWRWENFEGPIATPQQPSPSYSNWLTGEPNEYANPNDENYLAIGLSAARGWNDEGNFGNIQGYIVEYDVPRTAACTVTGGVAGTDCNTIDGQKLVFPTGSYDENSTIKFTAYEFTDPRVAAGTCGIAALPPLFTDPVFNAPDDSNPLTDESRPLKIPPYLCGSPDFVVVKVNSEDLSILKGAVLVVNNTEVVLPGNLYQCSDPILGNLNPGPHYSPDPQYQDVVVWQSTNPANMIEVDPLVGGTGIYQGAATEATNGCGSTVAKVRGASYFVVGLHIDFGAGYDYATNPLPNYQQFVALTKYKLSLLQKSVANARSVGSVKNPDGQAMASQVKNAISKLNAGDPAGALTSINQFINKVNSSTYFFPPSVTFNYNGDHLMRGENIRFMLRVKVIPYK